VASEITQSESFPIQTLSKGAICSVNLVVGGKTQKIAKSIASRNLHRGGFGFLPPKFTNVINLQKMKILPEINAVKKKKKKKNQTQRGRKNAVKGKEIKSKWSH
jgi:hypothetical protein